MEGLGSLATSEGMHGLAPALLTPSLLPGRDEKAKFNIRCLAMEKNRYLRLGSDY